MTSVSDIRGCIREGKNEEGQGLRRQNSQRQKI